MLGETNSIEKWQSERSSLEEKLNNLSLRSKSEIEKLEAEKMELQQQLVKSEKEKNEIDSHYKNLLGKVSGIRSTLGERLKADSEEIARQKTTIEYLEQKVKSLTETITQLQHEVITASDESDRLSKELASLRQTSMAAQDSWQRERSNLISKEQAFASKLQDAQRSAEDWEVIANEEKTMRLTVSERVSELEEQLHGQKAMYEGVMKENSDYQESVRNLHNAISVMQQERQTELHEVVEKMQSQIDALVDEKTSARDVIQQQRSEIEIAQAEIERMKPFEKEVKEKALLIGKLRHEAVILNEHLTKALRLLKKGTPDENVDRQLITNLLLSFLSLPRSDTKRFEILGLIAACLSWNDEQKTVAGLIRPGSSAGVSNHYHQHGHSESLSGSPTSSSASSPQNGAYFEKP
ncbi:hypothetical protein V1511DRAFT_456316 [Dipodascopsis uninucleata]